MKTTSRFIANFLLRAFFCVGAERTNYHLWLFDEATVEKNATVGFCRDQSCGMWEITTKGRFSNAARPLEYDTPHGL